MSQEREVKRMSNSSMTSLIYSAVQTMEQQHEEWKKNHPDEQEEVCPICKGTGLKRIYRDYYGHERSWLHRNDPGTYEYIEPCICVKNIPSQKLINDKSFANVPGLYKDARLDNFRIDIYNKLGDKEAATSAIQHVGFYITHYDEMLTNGIGMYIWSAQKGSGKSRLASTISNELTLKGYRNKFASASTILSEIQAAWSDKSQDEYKIIKNYIKPNLLIIDDFGARSGQAWMDEKFFMILDKRYQDNKPTIITSNYSIEKLPFNDQRILDRLQDIDRFVVVDMPKESVRDKAKNGNQSLYYQMVQAERERREKEKNGT